MPRQHNLRGGYAVALRNLSQHGVLQQVTTVTQRAPRLGRDAVLGVNGAQCLLREIGVQLNLVDNRNHAGLLDNLAQLLLGEVRNTNGTDLTLLLQLNQRTPGIQVQALLRLSPVNQVQVNVVGAQLLQGRLERLKSALVALIGVPQLGGEEDVLTSHAGVSDSAAYARLVAVNSGGVDVAVADLQGGGHDLLGDLVLNLPHAVAQLRNGSAVVELYVGYVVAHDAPLESMGRRRLRKQSFKATPQSPR